MRAVEIRLPPSELSKQMAAMRVWLDEYRFESSSFACRDSEYGVLVCLEFKIARQADEFAKRFGGRASGPPIDESEEEAQIGLLEPALSPGGVIG
jgi:hypothetical protein